jgi:hypothetical protein
VRGLEGRDAVADHAREYVEAAGRTFRIGRRREIARQLQSLFEFDDVDAAGFQYRAAIRQLDLVQRERIEPFADRALGRRQETRAHTPGACAETEIEARRLDLVGAHFQLGRDGAALGQCGDRLRRKDSGSGIRLFALEGSGHG